MIVWEIELATWICVACWAGAIAGVVILLGLAITLDRETTDMLESLEDVCGYCGRPGADKVPSPHRWPGEVDPGTPFVHRDCEDNEASRAMNELTPVERRRYLDGLFD